MKNILGELVRVTREKQGWTQEVMAQISGVSERTLQRLEAGSLASQDTVRALATAFKQEFRTYGELNKQVTDKTVEECKSIVELVERSGITNASALPLIRDANDLVGVFCKPSIIVFPPLCSFDSSRKQTAW